jgi:hypothetical protein
MKIHTRRVTAVLAMSVLMVSMPVRSAWAEDLSGTGNPGTTGAAGGGTGGAGQTISLTTTLPNDPSNTVNSTGGMGGTGGVGAGANGNGGQGGVGGDAIANCLISGLATVSPYAQAAAYGGTGGPGGAGAGSGLYGPSGNAGNATATATGSAFDPTGGLTLFASAYGGSFLYTGGSQVGGRGGDAYAVASVNPTSATPQGYAQANVYALGGYGESVSATPGNGGDGGNATAAATVRGSAASYASVSLTAYGGDGGAGEGAGHHGGAGGVANAAGLTFTGSPGAGADLVGSVTQQAGFGGDGVDGANAGAGGPSNLTQSFATSTGEQLVITGNAYAGSGGSTYLAGYNAGPGVGSAGTAGAATCSQAISAPMSIVYSNVNSYGGAGGSHYGPGTAANGGTSAASVQVTAAYTSSYLTSVGGSGGNGGGMGVDAFGSPEVFAGNGGNGGAATGWGTMSVGQGIASSSMTINVFGGTGGNAYGPGAVGGTGGAASFGVVNTAVTIGTGTTQLSASLIGGAGGAGLGSASGGRGADAVATNAVTGTAADAGLLNLSQYTFAGAGGASDGGTPGAGGVAGSYLHLAIGGTASLIITSSATGGAGGGGYDGTAGLAGATASAFASAQSNASADAYAYATGGAGGATDASAPGGAGAAPGAATAYASGPTEATAFVQLSGGSGGAGSTGGQGASVTVTSAVDADSSTLVNLTQSAFGGTGGNGTLAPGAGGSATASLSFSKSVPTVTGFVVGAGGAAGNYIGSGTVSPVAGAPGSASVYGTNSTGSINVTANGFGGGGSGGGQAGGPGATGTITAYALGMGGSGTSVYAYGNATGGPGGLPAPGVRGSSGGNGGAGVGLAQSTATDPASSANAIVNANGGNGGSAFGPGSSDGKHALSIDPSFVQVGTGGNGGTATGTATAIGGAFSYASVVAIGGAAGNGFPSGHGGNATATATVQPTSTGGFTATAFANAQASPSGDGDPGDALATASLATSAGSPDPIQAESYSTLGVGTFQLNANSQAQDPAKSVTLITARPSSIVASGPVISGAASASVLDAVPTAAAAAAAYAASPAVKSFFGNGTGTLAVGTMAATQTTSSSANEQVILNISLTNPSLYATSGLYVGIFNASGSSSVAQSTFAVLRDGVTVESYTAFTGNDLVAGVNNTVLPIFVPDGTTTFNGGVELYLNVTNGNPGSYSKFDYVIGTQPIANQWFGGGPADFNTASDWTANVVPTGAGSTAKFNTLFTGAGGVSVNSTEVIGTLAIDGGGYPGWQFYGTGQFNMTGTGAADAQVVVTNGNAQLHVPILMVSQTHFNVDASSVLTVDAEIGGETNLIKDGPGEMIISWPASYTGTTTVNAGELSITGTGDLPAGTRVLNNSLGISTQIAGLAFSGTHSVSSISGSGSTYVDSGSTVYLTHPAIAPSDPSGSVIFDQASLAVGYSGTLAIQTPTTDPVTGDRVSKPFVVVVGSISLPSEIISPTQTFYEASIDLNDSDMIVHGMTIAQVTGMIASWYDGGLLDGGGLKASAAGTSALAPLTTLGVILNDDGTGQPLYTTFDGVPVTATDVLVKYTYLGDTTLKGYVDAADLANLLAGMNGGLAGWVNGDTNYDGAVDATDLSNLLASLAGQGSSFAWPGGGNSDAVPEPAAWIGLCALWPCLGRRRR